MARSNESYKLTFQKFLSLEEQFELEENLARAQRDKTLRPHGLFVELVRATGCRSKEALNLEWKDLNYSTHSVMITGLKGSNSRELPLSRDLFSRLGKLPMTNNKIFQVKERGMRYVWEKFSSSGKGIKSLRHTFGLTLFEKTKNIKMVQLALGHRSIINTLIYMDYYYSQTELRGAILGEVDQEVRTSSGARAAFMSKF